MDYRTKYSSRRWYGGYKVININKIESENPVFYNFINSHFINIELFKKMFSIIYTEPTYFKYLILNFNLFKYLYQTNNFKLFIRFIKIYKFSIFLPHFYIIHNNYKIELSVDVKYFWYFLYYGRIKRKPMLK